MHRVLQIPEVLLNIFCRCVPSGLSEEDRKSVDSDLAALARTCRAFKEPALDILWSELKDPSPLSRCLPEISHQVFPKIYQAFSNPFMFAIPGLKFYNYSFTRPLERAEWDILRSYTCRVWCIRDFQTQFNWRSVRTMDFTPSDPLFPNLRSLHCEFTDEIIPLLHLPFPSLIRLNICLPSHDDLCMLQDPLRSLVKTSPNIKRLDTCCEDHLESSGPDEPESSKIVCESICGWSNLETLTCPKIFLDVDSLAHLSRMPALTGLTFMLGDTFPERIAPSDSLSFSALNYLKLHAESLAPISRLLSWTRLPAITDFTVIIDDCPSKQDFSSFMAGIQMVGMGQTIQEFSLDQVCDDLEDIEPRDTDAPLLDLDDLWPCMAFHHLRRMNVDLEWNVGLSDDALLTLVSAWPRLEELFINTSWGWNTPGITPNGLALLLETCPYLTSIALAIDTRGYTQLPATRFREPISPSSFDRPFHIDVLDSVIEEESVDAMAAFFARIVPHFDLILTAWEAWSVSDDPELCLYREHWGDVQNKANEGIKKRWLDVLRELFCSS